MIGFLACFALLQAPPATVHRELAAMGTALVVEVEALGRSEALAASEAAVRAVEAVEQRLSTWTDTSELARLNRAPVGVAVELSPALAADLARLAPLVEATEGAFDPTVGPLIRAWGVREGGRRPSPDELARARSRSGWGTFGLQGSRATREVPGAALEEGGFGKGVALDAAVEALRTSGAVRAWLDLGGQWRLWTVPGEAPRPLRVGVAHPRDRERAVAVLEFEGGSVATSGNSERGILVDGKRRSHILDPRTGEPARDFGSLTVWAPDGLTADALSTGLFVLGPKAALEYAQAHEGVDVVVARVGKDGRPELVASAGLRGRLVANEGTRLRFDLPSDTTD